MAEEWSLRDEIFHAAHRWPVFMLFCMVGALIGGALSLTLPSPFRATKELYIGLNIYTSNQNDHTAQFTGMQFINVDDYKNWQMANLNSLVYLDPVIDHTLDSLRDIDPYWESIDRIDLRNMLHVYWRNAGKWRLVAEHLEADHAQQAVIAWETAVVEHSQQAIEQSHQVIKLHIQMQAIADQQAEILQQQSENNSLFRKFEDIQKLIDESASDQILEPDVRQELWNRVSIAATQPEWLAILESFPTQNFEVQAYQSWLDQAKQLSQIKSDNLDENAIAFDKNYALLAEKYATASEKSLGLSTSLNIEPITTELPQITQIRPIGLLLLIGTLLGVIVWLLFNLVQISQKRR